ncbi:hypothetical protein [Nitrosarchaeum sp. AC2]|uniref:hypothetical protein n=1 Tax=Nitrosarchaeum sp. AC2 TaxID=2259673 RepID=UPI0015CD061D|nr:hypothetical protein [Nitrosarchaeum sp. AC2]QLH11420.1 hypothetical protein DSQ20_08130 [Nitrosarchaeum sp. AC2]
MNLKILFLIVIVFTFAGLLFSTSYADVASPKKQLSFGIDLEDISCKEGFMRVYLLEHETPSCIKISSVKKLVQRYMISDFDLKQFEKKEKTTLQEVGSVKIESTVQSLSKSGKSQIPVYDVIFNICSISQSIESPVIELKSNAEKKQIQLANSIEAKSCQISVGQIQATNPESISIQLINKGTISQKVNDLTLTINNLQLELEIQRKNLSELIKSEKSLEVSSTIEHISKLRKQTNDVRDELNSYLLSLNLTPTTTKDTLKIPTPTPRKASEGMIVKIISKYDNPIKNNYDIAFEACSGKEILRIPIVTVSSDLESKTTQLGDKISPNSCLISGTKISASDPNTIQIRYQDSGAKAQQIDDLDKKLDELNKQFSEVKKSLNDLINLKPRPVDFAKKTDDISQNIIKLRDEILHTKSLKYKILSTE